MKSLYISSLEEGANSLPIAIGLMQFLKQNYQKVAYFRPIVKILDDSKSDFMLNHFKLKQTKKSTCGFTVDEIQVLIASNKTHDLYEKLIEKCNALKNEYDFVLIEGISKEILSVSIDFDINLVLAKHFNTPFASVLNGKSKSIEQLVEDIEIEANSIKKLGCHHFGTFVNNLSKINRNKLKELIKPENYLIYFLREIKDLEKLTMSEVKESLHSELIFGTSKNLNQKISEVKIASMTLENYIQRINKENLVIVSGDRSDIILGSLTAISSRNMPHISGLVLTGGLKPTKAIMKLLEGFKDIGICILSVDTDTHETALDILNIKPKLTYKNYTKIALILGVFSKSVDIKELKQSFKLSQSNIMTPIMFEFSLFEKAKHNKKHIVLNESLDDRILRACEILIHNRVVNITLIGDKNDILHKADILGLNLKKANIINPKISKLTNQFAKEYYNLRKSKGITLEYAKDIMLTNDTYFATMMVELGYVDGMVSGAIATTANTVRPALQIIKTKPNINIVSSVFFMCFDTKVLVYGDCAINPSPNAQELSQIALSSAYTARQFDIEPKVAMLSYSTGTSGAGEDVVLVLEATNKVKKIDNDLIIEGPIQYDTAIDKQTALQKLPNSQIKGDATVLIFPDLNTGNNTYKAVQRSSDAVAIGPILQGLNKPINDLSRGCKVVDIVNTVVITAIQAQS